MGRNIVFILLCLAATAGNYILSKSMEPFNFLYLDTVFTVAAAFLGGPWAGIVTAVLTTIALGAGFYSYWGIYLFGLCNAAAALVTWFFTVRFPRECLPLRLWRDAAANHAGANPSTPGTPAPGQTDLSGDGKASLFERLIMLCLMSLTMILVISVMGGIIGIVLKHLPSSPMADAAPESYFKLGLFKYGLNLASSEILSRLPINALDRPMTVFAAYGITRLVKKIVSARSDKTPAR